MVTKMLSENLVFRALCSQITFLRKYGYNFFEIFLFFKMINANNNKFIKYNNF